MISLLCHKQSLQKLDFSSLRHFIEHLSYTTKSSFFCKTSNQIRNLNPTKPPKNLLNLLKKYGFSEPQVGILLTRRPYLVGTNSHRNLAPKLRFFRSLGFANTELAKMLCLWYPVLDLSLVNRYMPNWAILKSILQDDAKVRRSIKQFPLSLKYDLDSVLLPRIKALQDFGVTDAVIKVLLCNFPQAVVYPLRSFEETFDAIKGMGISPSKIIFAHAFYKFNQMNEKEWDRKLEYYRMLGWSRKQVMYAFVRHPCCMYLSDEKLKRNVEFFKEKLQWGPEYISKNPTLLSYSFEKRIQPRCLHLEHLKSKGLFTSKVTAKDIQVKDKDFFARYVVNYQSEVPEILHAIGGCKTKLESSPFSEN